MTDQQHTSRSRTKRLAALGAVLAAALLAMTLHFALQPDDDTLEVEPSPRTSETPVSPSSPTPSPTASPIATVSEQDRWFNNLAQLQTITDLPSTTCFPVSVTNWTNEAGEVVRTPLREVTETPTFHFNDDALASSDIVDTADGGQAQCVANVKVTFADGFPVYDAVPAVMQRRGYAPIDAAQPREAWNYATQEYFEPETGLADYLNDVLYADSDVKSGQGTRLLDETPIERALFDTNADASQEARDAVPSGTYKTYNEYAEALIAAYGASA